MQIDNFIKFYTGNKCNDINSFLEISKTFGIYFEILENEIIVCYEGNGNWLDDSFSFYKTFYPETELSPSSFNLISNINDLHKKFLVNGITEIYRKYGFPPKYSQSLSIKENVKNLLNTLKYRVAIFKDDMEFIKYALYF